MVLHFHLARITIELASPLSVGSGDGGWLDVSLLRDANGLPMLSGAALKGLLKALAARENTNLAGLFGDEDCAGRLIFSHGAVHDSKNEAVCGLRDPAAVSKDVLLAHLLREDPVLRDHVRLDARGTSEDSGKFDRTAVPRGTRFSFEIGMWGDVEEAGLLQEVAQLVWHPLFRPGGATRRGYGRITPILVTYQNFRPDKDGMVLQTIRRDAWSRALCEQVSPPTVNTKCKTLTLSLSPRGLWRAGSEGAVATMESRRSASAADSAKEVDSAFTREAYIAWLGNIASLHVPQMGGALQQDYVLQGASIRGGLAHRALFHWNRANGGMIDAEKPPLKDDLAQFSSRRDSLLALFGDAKDDNRDVGVRSPLIVEDVVFKPVSVTPLEHNSLDRFTGGVRNAVLFSEELVQTGALKFQLVLDGQAKLDASALQALEAALNDLVEGRLALGAKSSGRFSGDGAAIASFCDGTSQ